MDAKSLKILLDKLNNYCGLALEAAVGFAVSRGHFQVTPAHVLLKLLEQDDRGHIDCVLKYFDVNQDELWHDLLDAINNERAGNKERPSISESLYRVLEKACLVNSLHYGQEDIDTCSLVEAILELGAELPSYSAYAALEKVSLASVRSYKANIVADSREYGFKNSSPISQKNSSSEQAGQGESALDQFTIDLTEKARSQLLDPITGRNEEIRMAIDILCRRRKNNPILVGEPGVGKTAVVEGLAQKIVAGEVPESLTDIRICVLDLGLLQAGAGVKGEFERRLKQVIEEVKINPDSVMLFIDEAHTLIGAGGDAGLSDAANLLKPALARGELRTIAATTFSEYKQYFERDPALERRFQIVKVEEPTTDAAMLMLHGIKDSYQKHHNVTITDAALEASVLLSQRYITGRYLPDKAIDLLDTAAARVTMGQSVKPHQLETLIERQKYIESRIKQLGLEAEQGLIVDESFQEQLQSELAECIQEAEELRAQWAEELDLVDGINATKVKIEEEKVASKSPEQLIELSREKRKALLELQATRPLVQPEVNELAIADVVADWTGIPVGSMSKNDLQSVLTFEDSISELVIGQDKAIHALGQSLRSAKAGLRTNEGPVGCFMLSGPSGVGKTETARAIAQHLFGSEKALITINMSEYQESHTVSQLKGSPPGYVGYGQGGVLTEAVRNRPYSVVLLDEVEKAHVDVMNLFYQVFDKGFMRDGEGREIDFSNTLILMTSNLGAQAITDRFNIDIDIESDEAIISEDELSEDKLSEGELPEGELSAEEQFENAKAKAIEEWVEPTLGELTDLIKPDLLRHFAPALVGRMQVVPFVSLSSEVLSKIVSLKLDTIAQRMDNQYSMELRVSNDVLDHLSKQCESNSSGARFVNSLIDHQLMPNIAKSILQFMSEDDMPDILTLSLNEEGELECVFADIADKEEQIEQTGAVSV